MEVFLYKQIFVELIQYFFMRKIDRFDKYMKFKGLNDNKVTVILGLSVGTLGKSRKEGRDLSASVIEQILNYFNDLDSRWLMTGEGSMLKVDATAQSFEEVILNESDQVKELKRLLEEAQRKIEDQQATIDRQTETINTQAKTMQMLMSGMKVCG